MKQKEKIIMLIPILIIILGLSPVVLGVIMGKLPPFDFGSAINMYIGFLGDFIIVVIGFFLVHVFWVRWEEQRKNVAFDLIFKTQIEYIGRLVFETNEILSKVNNIPQDVIDGDRTVTDNWNRIMSIIDVIISIIEPSRPLSPRTIEGYVSFRDFIQPKICKVNEYIKANRLRADIEIVESIITDIGKDIHTLLLD